jgi:uncharacterized protein with HXXEE motif
VRAWLLLVGALALHVADEALTGFLDFYNPLVMRIREAIPWFPAPTFTFAVWLSGLLAGLVALTALAPAVRRDAFGTRFASWALTVVMFMNGAGHLAGSIYFRRWLPGTTSAPLLLIASVILGRATVGDSHRR